MKLSPTEIQQIQKYLFSKIKLNGEPITYDKRFQLIQNDDNTLSIVLNSYYFPVDVEMIEKLTAGILGEIHSKNPISKTELTSPTSLDNKLEIKLSAAASELIINQAQLVTSTKASNDTDLHLYQPEAKFAPTVTSVLPEDLEFFSLLMESEVKEFQDRLFLAIRSSSQKHSFDGNFFSIKKREDRLVLVHPIYRKFSDNDVAEIRKLLTLFFVEIGKDIQFSISVENGETNRSSGQAIVKFTANSSKKLINIYLGNGADYIPKKIRLINLQLYQPETKFAPTVTSVLPEDLEFFSLLMESEIKRFQYWLFSAIQSSSQKHSFDGNHFSIKKREDRLVLVHPIYRKFSDNDVAEIRKLLTLFFVEIGKDIQFSISVENGETNRSSGQAIVEFTANSSKKLINIYLGNGTDYVPEKTRLINSIGDAPAAIQFIEKNSERIFWKLESRLKQRFLLAIQMFMSSIGISITDLKTLSHSCVKVKIKCRMNLDNEALLIFSQMFRCFFNVKAEIYEENTIVIDDIKYIASSDCMKAVEDILKFGVPSALQGHMDEEEAEDYLNSNYFQSYYDDNHHKDNESKGIIRLEQGNNGNFYFVSSLINIKTHKIFHTKINIQDKMFQACCDVGLLRGKFISTEQAAKLEAEFKKNVQDLQGRVEALLAEKIPNTSISKYLDEVLSCLQAPACSEISVKTCAPPYTTMAHYIRGIDEKAVADTVNKQVKELMASYTCIEFGQNNYSMHIIFVSSKERVIFTMDMADISYIFKNMPKLFALRRAEARGKRDNKANASQQQPPSMAAAIAKARYGEPQDPSTQNNASTESSLSKVDSYTAYKN